MISAKELAIARMQVMEMAAARQNAVVERPGFSGLALVEGRRMVTPPLTGRRPTWRRSMGLAT